MRIPALKECLVTHEGISCLEHNNIGNYLLFYFTLRFFEIISRDIWYKKSDIADVSIPMVSFT